MDRELIEKLESTMERVGRNKLANPIRPAISAFEAPARHMLLLGSRGTGKSTLLLAEAAKKRILYFSADDYDIPANGIHDVASDAFALGYEGVFIDEVHFDLTWDHALKSLYDKYQDRIIWASDSSVSGIGETTRRYVVVQLPLMSFREYLFMKAGLTYEKVANPFDFKPDFKVDSDFIYYFEEYKKEGFLPLFLEGNYEDRVKGLVTKVISNDIPFFVPRLEKEHLLLMKEVMRYLASGSVPRLETANLSRTWGVSYDKLLQLFNAMEQTGLIMIVPQHSDPKEKFGRAKVFLANPSLYYVLGGREGNLREALTALSFRSAGWTVQSSKDETEGDFVVISPSGEIYSLEVGGKSKKAKQSDYVIRDNIDYPSSHVIPLWVLAMMW